MASGADSGAQREQERGGSLPACPLHHPLHGFMRGPLGGPSSLATTIVLVVTHEAFHDLPAPHLWLHLTPLQPSWPFYYSTTPAMWLPQGLCTCCSLCLACSSSCYLYGWLPHFLLGLSSIVTSSVRPFLTTLSKIPGSDLTLPLPPSKSYFPPSHVLLTRCFTCLLSVSLNPTETYVSSIRSVGGLACSWPRAQFLEQCLAHSRCLVNICGRKK